MKTVITAVLIFIFSATTFSQDYKKIANPGQCKKVIQNQQKATKSLAADFREIVYSSMFETPQKGSGKMLYKHAQKIRWEKIEPKKSIILINGKTILLSENGKEVSNPTTKTIVKKIQNIMVQMLSGDFLNEKEFSITYFENGSNYKLQLTPKSDRMARYIERIDLIFDKKDLILKEMSMLETAEEKIVYTFINVQVNGIIYDTKFTKF